MPGGNRRRAGAANRVVLRASGQLDPRQRVVLLDFYTRGLAAGRFGFGALGAWARRRRAFRDTLDCCRNRVGSGRLGAAGWRWGLFNGNTFAGWMQIWGLSLVWLTACGVLALSLRPGWLARGLAFKPLAHLGRVSYGFYVFHLLFYDCDRIVIDAIKPRVPAWPVHVAIFAWVWLLSWASFRWYETPFLRLKSRWGGGSENRKAVPAAEARASSSVP